MMAAFWTLLGLPLAMRAMPRPLCWFLAPALGWAIHGALSLPLHSAIGMSRPVVLITTIAVAMAAAVALWLQRSGFRGQRPDRLLVAAVLGAVLLALVPMMAILPHETSLGTTLAPPIFDHSKIAMIDEMRRFGVPAKNPFFSEIGAPERVSYYYLWHFSAALMAILAGVNGWEADAALTWFTACASLLLMVGIATWVSGRGSAGIVAIALAATGSARVIVGWLLGSETTHALVGWSTGFGGWLFQVSWAPQHVASAMSVVLACILLANLASTGGVFVTILLALVAAAGFQSSAWVGGVTFAIAAVLIGANQLRIVERQRRLSLLLSAGVAAALAIALAAPFIYDQAVTTALRDGGVPLTIAPVQVLGSAWPEAFRRLLDLPAYWLVYLPLEFPAFYPAGMIGLFWALGQRSSSVERRELLFALSLLVAASLTVAWLLVSVVGGNNDLGWRAILPAAMLLIAFAAAGLSHWLATRAPVPSVVGVAGLLLGLPEGALIAADNMIARPNAASRAFAESPAMWDAVRRSSSAAERVANNPNFLGGMTSWPVNISWALLADRRSCYAGWELALPFAPLSAVRRAGVDALFVRVFDGTSAPDDVAQLSERYRCDVVVITPQDGAWLRDPFAASDRYRVVESRPAAWRIYRRVLP